MRMPWSAESRKRRPVDVSDGYAIHVTGLRKTFGDFVAVNSIDLDVRAGEIFGFLGPNGSGKTTTIRMLCGTIEPTAGTARVMGFDINDDPERVRENIGYMSQKFSLFQDLTVDENLKFYAGIYGLTDEKFAERRTYILKMADLEGREDELTGNLSVGWKQRLALGCATIHEPELLFLDEPTSGVDPTARRQFWELLYDLADRFGKSFARKGDRTWEKHASNIRTVAKELSTMGYQKASDIKETTVKTIMEHQKELGSSKSKLEGLYGTLKVVVRSIGKEGMIPRSVSELMGSKEFHRSTEDRIKPQRWASAAIGAVGHPGHSSPPGPSPNPRLDCRTRARTHSGSPSPGTGC